MITNKINEDKLKKNEEDEKRRVLYEDMGGGYYNKYIKYKQKYLELKNKII